MKGVFEIKFRQACLTRHTKFCSAHKHLTESDVAVAR